MHVLAGKQAWEESSIAWCAEASQLVCLAGEGGACDVLVVLAHEAVPEGREGNGERMPHAVGVYQA